MPQCPVCQNKYVEYRDKICSECGWNLSFYYWQSGQLQISNLVQAPEALKHTEAWAKKKWQELSKLQTEINELTQERSRSQPPSELELTAFEPTGETMSQRADEYEMLRQQEREERQLLISLLQKADEERRQPRSLSGSQISELQAVLQKWHKERSLLQSQIQQFNQRLNTLEDGLKAPSQNLEVISESNSPYPVDAPTETAPPTFHPDTQTSVTQFQPAPTNQQLSPPEADLVDNYNHNPDLLSSCATEVSVTKESINQRRRDNSQPAILEPTRRGNYWILNERGLNYYMVPKANLKINEYNYETLEALFECQEYQPGYCKFQLIKPARVSPVFGGKNWQLVESGVLQFESS